MHLKILDYPRVSENVMLCHVVDHFKCVFFNKKFPFFVLLISSFSLTIIIRKVVVMDVQKGLFMPFISIIY